LRTNELNTFTSATRTTLWPCS